MANPLRTRAGFEWFDRRRGLVFTWSGQTTDSVQVTDRTGQTLHAEFAIPEAITAAMRNVWVRTALDLFEIGCAAWHPEAKIEAEILGYPAHAEEATYLKLSTAVGKANAAGELISVDHLQSVYELADDLVKVRG